MLEELEEVIVTTEKYKVIKNKCVEQNSWVKDVKINDIITIADTEHIVDDRIYYDVYVNENFMLPMTKGEQKRLLNKDLKVEKVDRNV